MTKPNETREGDELQSEPALEDTTADPDRIREDVEKTREDLGETVDALAAKTDVKAQLKGRALERRQALRDRQRRAQEKVSEVRQRVSNATPEDAKDVAGQATAAAKQRPLPAIGGALLVGMLLGWALRKR
jgi:ElaB/YqjD/DUF883 family membrane-anchored ribosome-binding protein